MLTNVTERRETDPEGPAQAPPGLIGAAEDLRASGFLGRSRLLIALFDYLVAASAGDRSPKESEIALEVFGKSGQFETGQDAVVRVYVHRLRRKLEDYARDYGDGHAWTLALPKGEYRIVANPAAPPSPAEPDETPVRPPRPRPWLIAGLAAAFLVINAAGWAIALTRGGAPAQARRSSVWAPFAASPLPLLIVTGDYYIFGESDDGLEVNRLVREYSVNSAKDLAEYLMVHPEKQDRYQNLDLGYLPTSAAGALNEIAPLFSGVKPARVVTASALTPQMMKSNDIIYIGYLSGMGALAGPVFTGSRFAVGDSFDDIVDQKSNRTYTSQGAMGPIRGGLYRDYGYVSFLTGPAGNHIAVIAGSRDVGLQAAAEQVATPVALKGLTGRGGKGELEALYEVQGQGDVDMETSLILAQPRKAAP